MSPPCSSSRGFVSGQHFLLRASWNDGHTDLGVDACRYLLPRLGLLICAQVRCVGVPARFSSDEHTLGNEQRLGCGSLGVVLDVQVVGRLSGRSRRRAWSAPSSKGGTRQPPSVALLACWPSSWERGLQDEWDERGVRGETDLLDVSEAREGGHGEPVDLVLAAEEDRLERTRGSCRRWG